MDRTLRLFILLFAAATAPGALAGTNLLPNGNFDSAHETLAADSGGCGCSYESGWWWIENGAYGAGWIAWQATDDVDRSSDSGALMYGTNPYGQPTWTDSECFAVPAGGAASVGGDYRIEMVNGASWAGFAFGLTCTVYSDACGGSAVATLAPAIGTSTTWAAMAAAHATLPADARWARCSMYLSNATNAQAAIVEVDDLFFSADFIMHDGFEP